MKTKKQHSSYYKYDKKKRYQYDNEKYITLFFHFNIKPNVLLSYSRQYQIWQA